MRVERRKTKTESFKHKNRSSQFSLCIVIFASIAKNIGIAKIYIFAMHSTFFYDSETCVANFGNVPATVPLLPAATIPTALFHFF